MHKISLAGLSLLTLNQLFIHYSAFIISTLYSHRKFLRVVSLVFPYYCALSLFNYTSVSPVYSSYFSHVVCSMILRHAWDKGFKLFRHKLVYEFD